MRVTVSSFIKQEILKNLIVAHKRLSEESLDIKGLIKLSKFILAVSKNMNNKIIQFDSVKGEESDKKPPNNS